MENTNIINNTEVMENAVETIDNVKTLGQWEVTGILVADFVLGTVCGYFVPKLIKKVKENKGNSNGEKKSLKGLFKKAKNKTEEVVEDVVEEVTDFIEE